MKYGGWFGRRARNRCPHSTLIPIYGDEVEFLGGWRLHCEDCGRFIDGPAKLAGLRVREMYEGDPGKFMEQIRGDDDPAK